MKSTSNTKFTQSSSTTSNSTHNHLVDRLFKSADPLCIEAATALNIYRAATTTSGREILQVSKALTVLLYSLDEIIRLSVERDNASKKLTEAEFKKRFNEIIHICSDAYFSYQRIMDEENGKTLRK